MNENRDLAKYFREEEDMARELGRPCSIWKEKDCLHYAIFKDADIEFFRYLFEQVGGSRYLNSRNFRGCTPLSYAKLGGRYKIEKYLISKGAEDFEVGDEYGPPPVGLWENGLTCSCCGNYADCQ